MDMAGRWDPGVSNSLLLMWPTVHACGSASLFLAARFLFPMFPIRTEPPCRFWLCRCLWIQLMLVPPATVVFVLWAIPAPPAACCHCRLPSR